MTNKDTGVKRGINAVKNLEKILKSERERLHKLIYGAKGVENDSSRDK